MAYNILIVDDSLLARTFTEKALTLSGLKIERIRHAANGREALDLMAHDWVDIVLADINMPEMSGIELVQHMKKSEILSNIPVVIVSTERSLARRDELKEAGVQRYICKPFTPENLKQVIEEVLGG